ncbi:MAG: hypothetical protein GX934_11735 [Burkholderiales bacterium]|nr:hypothetical protein [Burkholderiales bacterium]
MTYSPGPSRLTPAARRVLVAIHDLSEARGVPPTLREITEVTGRRAWSTVAHHVTTLQRLGLVHSYPGQPRGTYLTDAGRAEVTEAPTIDDAARHLRTSGPPARPWPSTSARTRLDAPPLGRVDP